MFITKLFLALGDSDKDKSGMSLISNAVYFFYVAIVTNPCVVGMKVVYNP
jgi:hypothetical protein